MRVLSIFVRHGTAEYTRAEQRLSTIFERQLPAVARDTVVVDTALPLRVFEEQPGRVLIGGDNMDWEFSGFESGIAHVGDEIFNYDLVNFATSALAQLYAGYLDRFDGNALAAIVDRPLCLGHIDCYNESIE